MSCRSTVTTPLWIALPTTPTSRGPEKNSGKIVTTEMRIGLRLSRHPYPVGVHRVLVPLLAIALLGAACTAGDSEQADPPAGSTVTTGNTPPSSSVSVAPATSVPEGGCPPGDVML